MTLPVFQATIVDDAGDVIPSAVITVLDESTGLAPADGLFSDRAGAIALGSGGVFTSEPDGFAQFYAAPGEYRITASDAGSGFSQTLNYQALVGTSAFYEVGAGATQIPTNADVSAARTLGILGTVSELAGVPTGSIFEFSETGTEDAVGYKSCVKFADGTMIQTGVVEVADVTVSRSSGTIWNSSQAVLAFLESFTAPPSCNASTDLDSTTVSVTCTSSAAFPIVYYFSNASRTSEVKIRVSATGRWF